MRHRSPDPKTSLLEINNEHRREIVKVYLLLRGLLLLVSLTILALAPELIPNTGDLISLRPLWVAWWLFFGWSIPLYLISWLGLRGQPLGWTDGLISLSIIPDGYALFLAARVTGGAESLLYHSVYFLIAVHSYHFPPFRSRSQNGKRRFLLLLPTALLSVIVAMAIYCSLASSSSAPWTQYGIEFALQFLTATAFVLVRRSNLKRAESLALSEENLQTAQQSLEVARKTESDLLQAMNRVSNLAQSQDEDQFVSHLRTLTIKIRENFACEFCALGQVQDGEIKTRVHDCAQPHTRKGEQVLQDLRSHQLGKGLIGRLVAEGRLFRWNSRDGKDFAELSDEELAALGIGLDRVGTRQLRDSVLISDKILHVLVAPFTTQDEAQEEAGNTRTNKKPTPLGYLLLYNRGSTDRPVQTGFSEDDEKRIRTLSQQLAVAIANFRAHRDEALRAEQESFFNTLTRTQDLDVLFTEVLSYLNETYSSRVASLWLLTEDGFGTHEEKMRVVLRSVQVAAKQQQDNKETKTLAEQLTNLNVFSLDECFIGRFFRDSGTDPRITDIPDITKETDCWAKCADAIGTPHLVAIPRRRHPDPPSGDSPPTATGPASLGTQLLGIICFRPHSPFRLTEEHRQELERFATHVAILMEQIRYRRRYRQIEVLKDGLPQLRFSDLSEFYSDLVDLVRNVLNAEACSFLTSGTDGELILKASTAEKAQRTHLDGRLELLQIQDYLGQPVYGSDEPSITRRIAELETTTLIYDVHRNPELSRSFMEVTETGEHHSLIGAPIRQKGKVLGVLRCINKKKQGSLLPVFVQGDKEFLDLIVGIMTRFIENAEASASKRDFLNQLAHELNTPLNALQGQINYLGEVSRGGWSLRSPEKQFGYLREQAEFLQFIVRDLQVQFGQGGRSRVRYHFSTCLDLKPRIERLKKFLLPTARYDRQIDIKTNTLEMPDLYVDPYRMEQVIFNLLQNAVKYSRTAGGDILLSYDLIEIPEADGTSKPWHRIQVQDWGIGVLKSDQPILFEEYRRGSNVEGAPSGTGLGLAVAKRIVEAHGGRLHIVKLKNPTLFAVDLPDHLTQRPPTDEHSSD